jgi:hypothetical protein
MGEGWGEGEYNVISAAYVPLPFILSHQGRGNPTFYECIRIDTSEFQVCYGISVALIP